MDRRFSSILDELNDIVPRQREAFVDSRARQVVASACNLMRLIEESYDAETADDLKRRLFNSIRTGDSEKFSRRIKKIKDIDESK